MFSLATRSDDSDGSAQRAPGGLGQLLLLKDADSVRLVIVTMGRGGFSSCSDVGTCSQKVNIVFLMGVELKKIRAKPSSVVLKVCDSQFDTLKHELDPLIYSMLLQLQAHKEQTSP